MIYFQWCFICFIPTSGLEKPPKNARYHSSLAAPFSKLLLNHEESRKVFNMVKLRLIHSFPTMYYTPRFDKWLKTKAKTVPKIAKFSKKRNSAI